MPKCKFCKKEIDHLVYTGKVEVTQTFTVNVDYPEYSAFDELGNHSDCEYSCPECNQTLFTEEEDALNFFLGIKK